MSVLKAWHDQAEEMFSQMVEWRRHLHRNPELSFQEVETPNMIAGILKDYGIEVRTGVGGRGVVGKIYGGKPGKTIALRADFDALPIQDEKEVEYKSTVPGVMHACGHDGHTATLLAVAKILSENKHLLAGNVVLIHQHAEELYPGGAIAMIEDGCLEDVDVVYGTHLSSRGPLGTFAYRRGYSMASADSFEIKIIGKGGHGSSPHETVDSIAIGAQVVNQLQHVVSRGVDPQKSAVLSVGSFHAGNANNVIADSAVITGTVRTFDEEVRTYVEEELKNIVKGVCLAFHADCEVSYQNGYPSVYNHNEEVEVFKEVISSSLDKGMLMETPPIMGGEDFAYYLLNKPGMFYHTGARNEETGAAYPHHHPKFDFDERAMVYAAKSLLGLVYHYAAVIQEEKAIEIV
ncbi:amidohydrolase [Bacillus sp. CMF21]|nr:amidohydrolase [Bacillus sp. CMF21]